MPDVKPPYRFSVTIGANCARQLRTFVDLAEKLKMPVEDLMRQANAHTPPSKALVKGLAKELGIDESYLEKLAAEGVTPHRSVLSPLGRIASQT
jgi:ribosome-binding protein aMBF1 (putative translation factor)